MRVYLDNCCYNRPFDDQTQIKVRVETICKLAIQLMMATGRVEYAWSSTLDYEVSRNPFPKQRKAVARWRNGAAVRVLLTDKVKTRAKELELMGLKAKDALHVASAENAGCDWFLTTDYGILKKVRNGLKMRIASPVDFIMEDTYGNDRQ